MNPRLWLVSLAAFTLLALPASAQMSAPEDAGFSPRVPVSGLARPSFALDPSRLHVSTSVTVGSFGQNVSGLSVTSLQYQFQKPLALSLSLGNAWGGGSGRGGFGQGSSFFLEGLDLTYRPSGSFFIHVGYHDLRSPLQLGARRSPFSPDGNPWAP